MYTISKRNETKQKINERQSRQYTYRTNTATYLKNCFPSHKILSFGKNEIKSLAITKQKDTKPQLIDSLKTPFLSVRYACVYIHTNPNSVSCEYTLKCHPYTHPFT